MDALGRGEGHGHLPIAGPLVRQQQSTRHTKARSANTAHTGKDASITGVPRATSSVAPGSAAGLAVYVPVASDAARPSKTTVNAAATPTAAPATAASASACEEDAVAEREGTSSHLGGAATTSTTASAARAGTAARSRSTGASQLPGAAPRITAGASTARDAGSAIAAIVAITTNGANVDQEHFTCRHGEGKGSFASPSPCAGCTTRVLKSDGFSGTTHTPAAASRPEGFDGHRACLRSGEASLTGRKRLNDRWPSVRGVVRLRLLDALLLLLA